MANKNSSDGQGRLIFLVLPPQIVLFQAERILSFIPPDGNFRLMSYLIGSQNSVAIPIFVRHQVSRSRGWGCSAAVEHLPRDHEDVGSNPAGLLSSSLLSFNFWLFLHNEIIECHYSGLLKGDASIWNDVKSYKNEYLAVMCLRGKSWISSDWGIQKVNPSPAKPRQSRAAN